MRARVLIALLLATTVISHRCRHDELQSKVTLGRTGTKLPEGLATARLLQSTEHQFKIHVEYSQSDQWIQQNAALVGKYSYSKRLIEGTRRYFEEMLKVRGAQKVENAAERQCNTARIPVFSKEVDLYVLVESISQPNTTTFASAYTCTLDQASGRPTIGVYRLNLAPVVNSKMNYLLYFSTFVHEFTHILFFNKGLFDYFVDAQGARLPRAQVVASSVAFAHEQRDLLVLKPVLDHARSFFKDPGLAGLPLENGGGEGSAGSHWEKAFMPMEYMNPSIEMMGLVSEFSLRFMQATGWYAVDLGYAQRYDWGRGHQDYHGSVCPTSAEYCSNLGEAGCSLDFVSKTSCQAFDTFMGNCRYKKNNGKFCLKNVPEENVPDSLEAYGSSSRCVLVKNSPKCLKSACSANNTVTLKLGASEVNCTANGQKIDFQGATVSCPADLADFCSKLNDACPDDCSGFGICLSNKKCFCMEGFSGNNCSQQILPDPSTELPPKPNNVDGGASFVVAFNLLLLAVLAAILL